MVMFTAVISVFLLYRCIRKYIAIFVVVKVNEIILGNKMNNSKVFLRNSAIIVQCVVNNL